MTSKTKDDVKPDLTPIESAAPPHWAVYDNQLLRFVDGVYDAEDTADRVRKEIVAEAKPLQDVDPADRFAVVQV